MQVLSIGDINLFIGQTRFFYRAMHLLYYVIMLRVVLSAKFSGVYSPNIKLSREDFAGSWLVPVQRFLQAKEYLQMHATNIESACFAILNTGSQVSVMTRDYFDFEVVHLSSTTNVLPSSRNELLAELLFRMNQTVNALDASSAKMQNKRYKINSASHRWRNQTIAVIAFTELSGSSSQSNFAAEMSVIFQSNILECISSHASYISCNYDRSRG